MCIYLSDASGSDSFLLFAFDKGVYEIGRFRGPVLGDLIGLDLYLVHDHLLADLLAISAAVWSLYQASFTLPCIH